MDNFLEKLQYIDKFKRKQYILELVHSFVHQKPLHHTKQHTIVLFHVVLFKSCHYCHYMNDAFYTTFTFIVKLKEECKQVMKIF